MTNVNQWIVAEFAECVAKMFDPWPEGGRSDLKLKIVKNRCFFVCKDTL